MSARKQRRVMAVFSSTADIAILDFHVVPNVSNAAMFSQLIRTRLHDVM